MIYFRQFFQTKKEIHAWLEEHDIENYKIHANLRVSVNDNVFLACQDLSFIPVKFQHVEGEFQVNINNLTSLEFAPISVGGSFTCGHNQLKTLEHCPQKVGGEFFCNANQLTNLIHCPQEVGSVFWCDYNTGLGKLQKITDFSSIYAQHLIEKEKHLLQTALPNNSSTTRAIIKL